MAKRNTGLGNDRRKSPHKTAKRLTAKFERLTALAEKRGKKK